jgi:hypothetical protein
VNEPPFAVCIDLSSELPASKPASPYDRFSPIAEWGKCLLSTHSENQLLPGKAE